MSVYALICACRIKLFRERHPSPICDDWSTPLMEQKYSQNSTCMINPYREFYDDLQIPVSLSPQKYVSFTRIHLTSLGLSFQQASLARPCKSEGNTRACLPNTVSEVRSFLNMVTYCAKFTPNFTPNFSDVTKPLREFTTKDAKFVWKDEHNQIFRKVKELLASDTVMAYFDKNKQSEITTDASPFGLSAILSQHTPGHNDRRIVAYVSRSFTPVEQRYSQTKREALAIVWAVERLHTYMFGGQSTLYTDCKPIELIPNNAKSRPPAHILQEYHFTTVHTKGQNNPSDFLSRHPSPEISHADEQSAEHYVNFIATHSTPKAMSLTEIKRPK